MGFGKDGKGQIIYESNEIDVSSLAANTALKAASLAMGEDFRILKTHVWPKAIGGDLGGTGPVIFGICDNELGNSEIAAALNTQGPLDANDHSKMETAGRPVFPLIQMDSTDRVPLNGAPVEWKQRWTFSDSESWAFFIYNADGTSALPASTTVNFFAKHYGVWVK